MLFDLPDQDILYKALIDRDGSYEGRVYVGVKTTGIFCRLTCPARKPNRENCEFYETVSQCLEHGFRPCKRCSPLVPAADSDPTVQTLVNALEKDPARRWYEGDIAKMGFDPSTVRRIFKRHFGITFLEMARHRRIQAGFTTLASGGKIIDAQIDAGFESPSAFRDAFAKLLGESPSQFTSEGILKADWIKTPLGPMVAVSCQSSLHLLEFVDRKGLPAELKKLHASTKGNIGIGRYPPTDQIEKELELFFDAKISTFETPITMHGTPFTCNVWRALQKIPAGEVRSYSDLAKSIDNPNAVRAVARANGANQLAIIIPCHRVIGADRSLTGYAGGLWRKQKLIELEQKLKKT